MRDIARNHGGYEEDTRRKPVITEYRMFSEKPLCPRCNQPMSVSDVIPTMPTTGFDQDEVVWKCAKCGTEVKQPVDRQRSEPVVLGR
jgi:ribosomal protein L37AE/L43A